MSSPKRDDSKLTLRQGARVLVQTLALVLRSTRAGTIGLALLTVASAGLPLALAWAGKEIVDAVVAGSHERTLHWVLLELLAVTVHVGVQRALSLIQSLLSEKVSRD